MQLHLLWWYVVYKNNSLDIKMIFIHIPSINTKFDIEKIAKIISNYIRMLVDETN